MTPSPAKLKLAREMFQDGHSTIMVGQCTGLWFSEEEAEEMRRKVKTEIDRPAKMA